MRRRFFILVFGCAALAWATAICSQPAQAYIADDWWRSTATDGSISGSPPGRSITVTWSFAPDGTDIPGNPSGTVDSNLLSFLDANFGVGPGGTDLALRPWFPIFSQSFQRFNALSGVNYIYEPKDDAKRFSSSTVGSGAAQGLLGTRGDVRIGGKSYGSGSNVLASNFYPDYGEMMINTDKGSFFKNSNNNYRAFRNTIMHEAMHGLGISHVESSNAAFLIEPVLSTSFDGPQLDDLLAIQRLYGDIYEKNGNNDVYSRATPLGVLSPAQPIAIGTLGGSTAIGATQVDFVSIDDDSDTDFFSFSLASRLDMRLQLSPRGTSYLVGPEDGTQTTLNTLALSNLSLALFDTNGTSLLVSADNNPAGLGEEVLRQLLPGTYYARVKGAQNNIQLYGLNLTGSVPLSRNLLWVGNLSANWNDGITANFRDGAVATVFYNPDNATFDDTASQKTVNLPANISAGNVRVTTAATYRFTGTGGIVAGNLTVDGTGTVELANSGNSYSGSTQVLSGTLLITGNANAMVSPITVANGATLVMNATDAATMASTFTINTGGVLQIGALASNANVFPDAPAAITNSGTIRVLDEELLRSVAGSGQIIVERETTSLQSNANFHGAVVVKAAAVARVQNGAGLGSAVGATTVENGGALVVETSASLSDALSIAGDGAGSGAIRVASGHSASLLGNVSLAASTATIHVEPNSTADFYGLVDGATNNARLTVRVDDDAVLAAHGIVNLGDGGITKQGLGTAELGGALNYAGATLVEQGLLRLTGTGSLNGEFQVAQNAALELAGANQLAVSSSFTGRGQIVGDILMPGTIAPGSSAGALTFANNLLLAETSRLDLEIGGTAAIDYDRLAIAGLTGLDGTLEVSLLNNFQPTLDNAFEVLRAENGVSGRFENYSLPELTPDLAWNVVYGDSSVTLRIVSTAVLSLPGDYNRDSVVDAADYVVLRKTFGQSGAGLAADGNGDEEVDAEDYGIWTSQFGQSFGGGGAIQVIAGASQAADLAVPEPAALVLLLTAGIMGFVARRR